MPIVGVIGGGQLARMMQPAAINLGLELRVFAESENSSAALSATSIGDYNDYEQLRAFAVDCDAITFDHEHVPTHLLSELEQDGIAVRPGPKALIHAQNKLVMRRKLAELGLPQPAWAAAKSAEDVEAFIAQHGPKIIVKTPIGGYDGKGVRVVSDAAQVADWLGKIDSFGGELLLEQKVDFSRELAQLSARRPSGEFKTFPLAQTIQENSVCSEVIAPAPQADFAAAKEIARAIAESLEVVGVMAVELFETPEGKLLVNELAMRPHNSGHFSMDGCKTSQFEQHLRAVLDLPLGDTSLNFDFAVMINLLGVDEKNDFLAHYPSAMASFPQVKFHLYQKAPRGGRKMGHLNLTGSNLDELLVAGRNCRAILYNQ
ncbi:5-(carboxyamino)imidazole ribonucleotide synthase [Aquiluna borgnonia]|uniref:N5-carboxyaminoimidazole ribonucleotide synthase n=1 Tax=Aquiluna borgnonia TaxID=2499157 RepID=A0A7D4U7A1_9MICO|nr:5-(carboxyamino)imidazole ribonucleotide synthase [Aquiluna borgnonia]